ncbi:hypothetical protein [Devosia sp.]|uniref:hypothetical protein n=1 Tax=Devosia sp. TaxID=1871048 RepID=UPI0025DB6E3D|nr:hypothetical protein [Devosia sp.]MCR6636272.1 hypothetical protein [Devosia sp.]
MVHFFGIFSPGPMARNSAEEAPAKANFFGGLPARTDEAALSPLEQDAIYLAGKAPEPEPRSFWDARHEGIPEQ